jgi:small subunit ribosomal protein S6
LATPRVYEILFIIKPDSSEEETARLTETFKTVITDQGGTLTKNENMGRRHLAYRIRQGGAYYREGVYILFEVEGSGREIAELERRMRVSDQIIRYITIRIDEDRRRAEKLRARRSRKANRRSNAPSQPPQRNRPTPTATPVADKEE